MSMINIVDKYTGKQVIKKLILKNYIKFWNHKAFDNAFHGTHFNNLESILKNGLHRPGDLI